MEGNMTLKQRSAVEALKSTHERVLEMFDKYNSKLSAADKEKVLADVAFELSVLSVLETEVFYPAIKESEGMGDVDRFVENHDQVKIMTAQAQRLMGDEAEFDRQFQELRNMVKKHFTEEEQDLFPKLEASSLDLNLLGEGIDKKRQDVTAKVVF
jgi:iron-sulfur cluster repair protein YtfE (RIC family)